MTPQERERYNEYKKAADMWCNRCAAYARINERLKDRLKSVKHHMEKTIRMWLDEI